MIFSLAFLATDQQVYLRDFTPDVIDGPASSTILTFDELADKKIQALFYPADETNDEIKALLHDETKFYPIFPAHLFSLSLTTFEGLNYDQAKQLCSRIQESAGLQHTLLLLSNLKSTKNHLRSLLQNDRTTFFEEVWFLLKNVLAARELTLIYHDLAVNEDGAHKNKLVVAKVVGHRLPSSEVGSGIEQKILSHYKDQLSSTFELSTFDEEKNELVAHLNIKKSPLIIMAQTVRFTRIQDALLKSLFDLVNEESK